MIEEIEKGKRKVIISFSAKLGIISVSSLEEYIKKNKIFRCYVVTTSIPHQNVVNYIKNIGIIEMIVSSDINQKIEEIKGRHKDDVVEIINLEDFGERNLMRDAV